MMMIIRLPTDWENCQQAHHCFVFAFVETPFTSLTLLAQDKQLVLGAPSQQNLRHISRGYARYTTSGVPIPRSVSSNHDSVCIAPVSTHPYSLHILYLQVKNQTVGYRDDVGREFISMSHINPEASSTVKATSYLAE